MGKELRTDIFLQHIRQNNKNTVQRITYQNAQISNQQGNCDKVSTKRRLDNITVKPLTMFLIEITQRIQGYHTPEHNHADL